jgi:hypothetical protein
MPEPDRSECPERIALEHAIRCWEAETQNAERLASRENGLLTLLSAIVGFGFFKLSDEGSVLPTYASLAVRAFLTVVLLLLLLAFLSILVSRWPRGRGARSRVRGQFASGRLVWPSDDSLQPRELASEQAAIRIALSRTSDAAEYLRERNVVRRGRLDLGQQLVVFAGLSAGLGFAVYVWSGLWSRVVNSIRACPPPDRTSFVEVWRHRI